MNEQSGPTLQIYIDGKPVAHKFDNYPEYARRNLLVAGAIGARAGVRTIRDRLLGNQTKPPAWLLRQLDEIEKRIDPTIHDLAQWRDVENAKPVKARDDS